MFDPCLLELQLSCISVQIVRISSVASDTFKELLCNTDHISEATFLQLTSNHSPTLRLELRSADLRSTAFGRTFAGEEAAASVSAESSFRSLGSAESVLPFSRVLKRDTTHQTRDGRVMIVAPDVTHQSSDGAAAGVSDLVSSSMCWVGSGVFGAVFCVSRGIRF